MAQDLLTPRTKPVKHRAVRLLYEGDVQSREPVYQD